MTTDRIRWFGIVRLVGQLALAALGAVSLWRIAGGWWVGAANAALLVAVVAGLWFRLLAPGSPARLRYRERLALSLVLGTAVVILGSLAGLWLPAIVATSVALLGDALDERSR